MKVNNERGFASLAAVFIMLIISLTIMSMTNIAARQGEIFNIDRQEVVLQNAAESAFYEVTAHLENDFEYYGTFENSSTYVKAVNLTINNIPVEVLMKKYDKSINKFPNDDLKTNFSIIAIRTFATAKNIKNNDYNIYKRVYGYMKRIEIVDKKTGEVIEADKNYEFAEYLE